MSLPLPELEIISVPIEQVYLDMSVYPRIEVDRATVLRYAREMDYSTFPSITVVKMREDYYLIEDGAKRWLARKERGETHIDIVVVSTPFDHILEEAYKANRANPEPFRERDQLMVAERLLEHKYTLRYIATKVLLMSEWTLNRKLNQRRGKLSVPTPPVRQPRATSGSVTPITPTDEKVTIPIVTPETLQDTLDIIRNLTDSIKTNLIYVENRAIRTAMKNLVSAWFKRLGTWERKQGRK